MQFDLARLFHEASKELKPIPHDPALWPDAWKRVEFKTYPRFPSIDLKPHVRDLPVRVDATVRQRRSGREFTGAPLSLGELATLLQIASGITATRNQHVSLRAYPSGGARYPLEIYVLISHATAELGRGLYHFNVAEVKLEVLIENEGLETDVIEQLITYSWARHAGAIIFLTAVFARTMQKYGGRGYRYILLEAGHLGQNLCLTAEALGLTCCPMGGVREDALHEFLDVNPAEEAAVYCLVIGR